jgi:hypothetical protein
MIRVKEQQKTTNFLAHASDGPEVREDYCRTITDSDMIGAKSQTNHAYRSMFSPAPQCWDES